MTKKASKHIPKHRSDREVQQKQQGDKVVKWIFGSLVVLAIIYMVWSMFIVQ